MTKFETKQCQQIQRYMDFGESAIAARSLSALYRSARTTQSQNEMLALANCFGILKHPDFVI